MIAEALGQHGLAFRSLHEKIETASHAGRLTSARTAHAAVGLQGRVSRCVAQAINVLLRLWSDPLLEPFAAFWPLFVEGRLRPDSNPFGRRRISVAVSARRAADMIVAGLPHLSVSRKLSFLEAEPLQVLLQTSHDIGHFEFRADERDWECQLEMWPKTSSAEVRRIEALDGALVEALETCSDASLLEHECNPNSWDIALVHAPEPDDGLAERDGRHRRGWR